MATTMEYNCPLCGHTHTLCAEAVAFPYDDTWGMEYDCPNPPIGADPTVNIPARSIAVGRAPDECPTGSVEVRAAGPR
jgi:hypothetical protein